METDEGTTVHRFLVDEMLGKLARLMRLAGFDTYYSTSIEDSEVCKIALSEDRVVLTRDSRLAEKYPALTVFHMDSDSAMEQFVKVAVEFDLDLLDNIFARCTECNGLLVKVDKNDYEDRIPPHVFASHDAFTHCQDCDRIYWRGTHYSRLADRLEQAAEFVDEIRKRDNDS